MIFIDPSRLGFNNGVGRWTLSQTTFCNGSTPFVVDEWWCPTNVVVDKEFGSVVGISNGVCFLLNVERRASGLRFRGRSRNGCGWIIAGNVCSFGSSIIVACCCCCWSVGTFGRGEGSKRARSDWWAAAGGGGGGVGDVTLENEQVRAGGRGGGSDGPVRTRFALAEKSFVDKTFVVPK